MNRIKDDSVIEIKLQKSVNIGRRQIHFRWLPNKFTTQLSLEVDQFQGDVATSPPTWLSIKSTQLRRVDWDGGPPTPPPPPPPPATAAASVVIASVSAAFPYRPPALPPPSPGAPRPSPPPPHRRFPSGHGRCLARQRRLLGRHRGLLWR